MQLPKITFNLTPDQLSSLTPLVQELFPDGKISVGYLLTTNSAKLKKGEAFDVLNAGLYLSPSTTVSESFNACPYASKWCKAACIAHTGHIGMITGKKAAIARTLFFMFRQEQFRKRLFLEIQVNQLIAEASGFTFALRLNAVSDIEFELPENGSIPQEILRAYPDINLYDYTKNPNRVTPQYKAKHGIEGYHFTLSFSGANWPACEMALKAGVSVAIPAPGDIPKTFKGFDVIDGTSYTGICDTLIR